MTAQATIGRRGVPRTADFSCTGDSLLLLEGACTDAGPSTIDSLLFTVAARTMAGLHLGNRLARQNLAELLPDRLDSGTC
jgi:hypothetical protein